MNEFSDKLDDKVEIDEKPEIKLISNDDDNLSSSKGNTIAIVGLFCLIIIAIAIILIINFTKDDENNKIRDYIENYSTKIRLKNWEFGSSENIELTPEEISTGKKSTNFYMAPEDVYVCTAMGGLSGHTNDYFYEKELANVNKTQFDVDWWFRSKFTLAKSNDDQKLVILHVNGINYKGDLYVDGNLIATRDNLIGTFIKYSFDITKYLNKDSEEHFVAFKIKRPHNQWGGKKYYNETDLAISFVDWNPEPPDSNMGIWQPVDVEIFNKTILTVSSAFVRTEILEDKRINLEIVFHVKNWENKRVEEKITIQLGDFAYFYLKDIVFESLEEKQIILNGDSFRDLNIKYDPDKLWWPYQMGKQNIHKLIIKISDYSFTKEVGLRQVESEYDTVGNKTVYKINKKKILLKGAGWTPDLFLRQSPEIYYNHIKYVRDMELNVIRLEGKSEGEEFYEYCDKLGILIISGWNCADAWQRWEYWDQEVNDLSDLSVISQIRKLSPHPSVIIFILGSDYGPRNNVEPRWRQIFEQERWPNQILSSAAESSSSEYPTGVKMSGPYSWVPPNYFYLNQSRNNKYGGAYGFLTEGGPGENPLRKGSYEKVFNDINIDKYDGESWNYHCGNKKVFGDLSKLIEPINERFGNIKDFDDFQRKSSAAVYEGHRAMFEAYESYRYESTGVIQWMLNNAWPSNIWHLYDYFFAPTPSYFATKKAGEKIHAMYNYENKKIYLINNYFSDFNDLIKLHIYIFSDDGKTEIYHKYFEFKGLKSDEINNSFIELNQEYGDNYIIHLEYSYNENYKEISLSNTYLLNKIMDEIDYETPPTFYNVPISNYANLEAFDSLNKVDLNIEMISNTIFEEDEQKKIRYEFNIENNGDVIALLLELKLFYKSQNNNEMIVPIIWSDNYFSIRSKNSYKVTAEFIYEEGKELYLNIVGWNNNEVTQKL